jgi:hypothetical protein
VPSSHLAAFLGPRAHSVVLGVPDPDLRHRVIAAIEACARCLGVVDALDLSPHELSDPETANIRTWEALAPSVGKILVEVRSTCEQLGGLFPAGADEAQFGDDEVSASDLEKAFDLMASPASTGDLPGASFIRRDQGLDLVVKTSAAASAAQVGNGIRTLVTVLHQDIVMLGGKLRTPQIVGDRWFLLGELHQFLGQCGQCLEAIVATILGALSDEHLDALLPRYTNATGRALKLRAAVNDLAHQLGGLNQAIAMAAQEDLPILVGAVIDSIATFSQLPTYKYLRPQDKRPIITFRVFATYWDRFDPSGQRLRSELEDFTKFLELMCDLNWREQLAEHDAQCLANARFALEGGMDLELVVPTLASVQGRSPAIDHALREASYGRRLDRDYLYQAIAEAEARLPGAAR